MGRGICASISTIFVHYSRMRGKRWNVLGLVLLIALAAKSIIGTGSSFKIEHIGYYRAEEGREDKRIFALFRVYKKIKGPYRLECVTANGVSRSDSSELLPYQLQNNPAISHNCFVLSLWDLEVENIPLISPVKFYTKKYYRPDKKIVRQVQSILSQIVNFRLNKKIREWRVPLLPPPNNVRNIQPLNTSQTNWIQIIESQDVTSHLSTQSGKKLLPSDQ